MGHAPAGQHLFERLPFDELHHQVRSRTGLLNSHIVQSDHEWMGKFSDHARFAKESCPGFAAGKLRRKQFDCDLPVNQRIKSADHAALSAGAERFENLVASDLHASVPPHRFDGESDYVAGGKTENDARVLISKYFRTGSAGLDRFEA